jgi:hypothetical protein
MVWNLTMVSDERERLTRRADSLRRLRESIDDIMARAAITAEIAKHEAKIAEIDSKAAGAEILAKAPPDIIS